MDLESRIRSSESIEGYQLVGAPLAKAKLSGALAAEIRLDHANLNGAELEAATLLSASLVEALLQNAVLRRAQLKFANLRGADLSGADLSEAGLRITEMAGAVLVGCLLHRSDFGGADLRGADLRKADLSSANLRGTDLRGAAFDSAILRDVQSDSSTLFEGATGLDRAFELPESLRLRLGLVARPLPTVSAPPNTAVAAAPKRTSQTSSMVVPTLQSLVTPQPAEAPPKPTPPPVVQTPAPAAPKPKSVVEPKPEPKPKPLAKPEPKVEPAPAPSLELGPRPTTVLEPEAIWGELTSGEPDRMENAAAQLDRKGRAVYAARLTKIALSNDPSTAFAATEALALLPEPSVASDLLKALVRGEEGPCYNAAWVFRKWAVPLLEAPLLKLLGQVNGQRRANLLWVLEAVGREESIEPIRAMGFDPDEDVRAAAQSALEKVLQRVPQKPAGTDKHPAQPKPAGTDKHPTQRADEAASKGLPAPTGTSRHAALRADGKEAAKPQADAAKLQADPAKPAFLRPDSGGTAKFGVRRPTQGPAK